MASSSAESACKCHVRSVSFPSISHPVIHSIEDALHRVKGLNTENKISFEFISFGLVENLCLCVADLLDMASTQQILRRKVVCTTMLLDSSILLLDVCSIARDLVSQFKEYVHLLQSTISRRRGDTSMKACLRDYVNFRNNARKDAKRLNLAMNQIKNRAGASQADKDLESSAVTRMLIEVNELSTATFQSVLHPFLNQVSGITPSRWWSSISRLVQKTTVMCQEKRGNLNELDSIDGVIHTLSKCSLDDEDIIKIQLQDTENSLNSLEVGLENMFRQLIRSRASLLNIISQ